MNIYSNSYLPRTLSFLVYILQIKNINTGMGKKIKLKLSYTATGVASSSARTPGSSLPSSNSKLAPPPVEMWLITLATPTFSTAATESPPPMIVVTPFPLRSASFFAIDCKHRVQLQFTIYSSTNKEVVLAMANHLQMSLSNPIRCSGISNRPRSR